MIRKQKTGDSLRSEIRDKIKSESNTPSLWAPPKGSDQFLLSTGSTLVDLAISGRRFIGGGIPMGIFVEVFGKSSKGKTVLLLEMAGVVQRMGGDYLFLDPEARVNDEFANIFDFKMEHKKYKKPNTITDAFTLMKKWEPKGNGPFVIFCDSIAALVSNEEDAGKGDEYSGARRARDFSQQLRQITRIIAEKNYLLICTNQMRQNLGAGPFGKKYKPTGGEAPEFYASLRLELKQPAKDGVLKMEKTIKGVLHKKIYGVQTDIFVEKSTVSTPYQTGSLRILFDYGVDDIVPNLVYLKKNLKASTYVLGGKNIGSSLDKAVQYIEHSDEKIRRVRIKKLKDEVIELWTEIQKELTPNRLRKLR